MAKNSYDKSYAVNYQRPQTGSTVGYRSNKVNAPWQNGAASDWQNLLYQKGNQSGVGMNDLLYNPNKDVGALQNIPYSMQKGASSPNTSMVMGNTGANNAFQNTLNGLSTTAPGGWMEDTEQIRERRGLSSLMASYRYGQARDAGLDKAQAAKVSSIGSDKGFNSADINRYATDRTYREQVASNPESASRFQSSLISQARASGNSTQFLTNYFQTMNGRGNQNNPTPGNKGVTPIISKAINGPNGQQVAIPQQFPMKEVLLDPSKVGGPLAGYGKPVAGGDYNFPVNGPLGKIPMSEQYPSTVPQYGNGPLGKSPAPAQFISPLAATAQQDIGGPLTRKWMESRRGTQVGMQRKVVGGRKRFA